MSQCRRKVPELEKMKKKGESIENELNCLLQCISKVVSHVKAKTHTQVYNNMRFI